ncbi:restriction modification system DNA specificity subunit (plasmid) [Tolypothrix tenuis PCC 7101]|uniref:Restriction modification system DNA specificity subunit n=1 Tax=Tolypothrix tenuis PCC 7101 TaxID=231146 RepID=A0A1Z4NC27_9CYAN|nr:restriction modification system DNA specificity subunit [Tolypothrix tenuis PCC 7101]BAZ78654.1 restriction modification system DNA specificity subunit [Aulosira laxa NIES-50]
MSFDELAELPEGWVWAKLGELGLFINGDRGKNYPNKNALVESGIPFINAGHIQDGIIKLSEMNYITEESFNLLGSGKVKPNDILYCLRGSLGKTAIVKNITQGAIASSLVIIRPCNSSKHEYLFYYLISPFGDAEIRKYDNGSAQPNLSAQSVKSYSIPLPPLNEQRRIVAKIEALAARSQRVKEALLDIPQLLDQFRQSVLAAAFRGDLTADWREQSSNVEPAEVLLERIRAERRRRWEESELEKMKASGKTPKDDKWKGKYIEPEAVSNEELPEIPEGWIWTDINNISFVVRGASPRPAGDPKYFGGNIPWITVAEITKDDEIYLTQTSGFVTAEGCKASRFIEPGTFLLTNSGATLGVPKITKIGGCINDGSVALLFVNGEIQIYLYYFLTSLTQTLRKINQGAAQPNLNTEIVRNIKIPIPPQEELQVIIKLLKHQLSTVSELKTLVNNKLELAVTLDQSILAKAFRGELVPQDPNDEPASVLLERIREERAKLQTKTAKKSTTKTSARRTKKTHPQEEESVQLELGLE